MNSINKKSNLSAISEKFDFSQIKNLCNLENLFRTQSNCPRSCTLPSLATDDNVKSHIILALHCNKEKLQKEVGFACIDLSYPHMILGQISDNNSFTKTISKINVYRPQEIIISDQFTYKTSDLEINLYQMLYEKFTEVKLICISRTHFSAIVGWDLIQIYCSKTSLSAHPIIQSRPHALSAASALLKYIVHIQRTTYTQKSLKIDYKYNKDSAFIDEESAKFLEIIYSLDKGSPDSNLFNALNKTVTDCGTKLLRTSLVQPICNEKIINERLDRITELIQDPLLLLRLQNCLKKMKTIDKILSLIISTNSLDNIKQAKKNLNYLLHLKNILDCVPEMQDIFEKLSTRFEKLGYSFQSSSILKIKTLISKVVEFKTTAAGKCISSNIQRCFIIKPKVNDLLDIVRQAYCELLDSILEYVESLNNTYSLKLTLSYNTTIGYYLQLSVAPSVKIHELILPEEFIIFHKKKSTIYIITEKLLVDGQRCKDMCDEIHIMSNVLIENVLEKITDFNEVLYQLCTDVSELDVIAALAVISSGPEFVRPKFGNKLCVINSYHPIKFLIQNETAYSNNIVASIPYNFQIITGPNLSGKTTFLKQILLLNIMAQIGCFVPAHEAIFRIADFIYFYSSNNGDYSDKYDASFINEMKRFRTVMKFLTKNSLIALDEPCVSSPTEDGICLAASICINLLDTRAFTFCATHYHYLTRISETFLNATNLNFNCQTNFLKNLQLLYTYQLQNGVTEIDYYGLAIASLSSLPSSVILAAKLIATALYSKQLAYCSIQIDPDLVPRRIHYSVMAKIYNLKSSKQLFSEKILSILKETFFPDLTQFLMKNLHQIPDQCQELEVYQDSENKEKNRKKEFKLIMLLMSCKILKKVILTKF